jgi:hypothetical protein
MHDTAEPEGGSQTAVGLALARGAALPLHVTPPHISPLLEGERSAG